MRDHLISFLFVTALGSAAVLAACGGGTSTTGTPDAGSLATDLPCEVAMVLQGSCTSCHGASPSGGAPMSLVSYADLTAKTKTDPTKTYAELSVARMQNAKAPMPPGAAAAPQDVAALSNWIAAGYPMGTCGAGDAGPSPYDTPTVCTSGKTSSSERIRPADLMHPGGRCVTCHIDRGEGPVFTVAGTVFPTAHEPDDCVGASGATSGAQVLILDKDGNTQLTLTPNANGNFVSETPIKTPYTAKVVAGGKERVMVTPQTDGECNSCHTEQGANGAPGRIMLP